MSKQTSFEDIGSSESLSVKENSGLPDKWDKNRADELMTITRGASPRPKGDPELFGGDIPWIKIGDVNVKNQRWTGETSDTVTEKGAKKSKLVDKGTLLVSNSGTCGYPVFVDRESCVHDGWLILRDYEDNFNPHYLYEFITYKQNFLKSLAPGSTQINLNTSRFGTLEINQPPLPEQRQIASVLYNVDRAIQKTEEIIVQTQRVKKGLMQDLFTEGYYDHEEFEEKRLLPLTQKMPKDWGTPAMSEIITSQKLGTGVRGKSEDPEENITLIKMGNLGFGNWDFSEIEKVEKTDEVMESKLEKGDLLFNTRNTPKLVGKTAVWEFDKEAVHDNNLMRINFSGRVATPHYVNYYLASDFGRTQLRGRVHGTTSVAAIYKKDLHDIQIPLPEKDEQREIANTLHSLDKKIEENREYKEQLQRLKKGLMQDLLTGEVRTDENVEVLNEVVEVES